MRAIFSSGVRTKGFNGLLAGMILALSALSSPLAALPAIDTDLIASDETIDEEPDDQSVTLASGTPTATSAGDIRLEGAMLTWTPTGMGEIEDTYEIIVATENLAEDSDRLTEGVVMRQAGLTKAGQDVSTLGEGTYYWQVRSCMAGAACKEWSEVYEVRIDGTTPEVPTAAITSDQYARTVTIGGMAEPEGKVTLKVGEVTCETAVDSTGAWSCTFVDDMDYGDYQAVATAYDKAGNGSQPLTFTFSVKELFVAAPIKVEELPPVLEVVPVSPVVENKALEQPIRVIDSVNMGKSVSEPVEDVLGVAAQPLSTEGGIVQSSENGWQVLGMPWFMWAGIGGVLSAGWFMYSGRSVRQFA